MNRRKFLGNIWVRSVGIGIGAGTVSYVLATGPGLEKRADKAFKQSPHMFRESIRSDMERDAFSQAASHGIVTAVVYCACTKILDRKFGEIESRFKRSQTNKKTDIDL